jgi:transposase
MFCDEASFGRISEPANCWAPPKMQPAVPCQRVRQYKPVYCAVSLADGESFFMALEKCDNENMEIFYKGLSDKFPDELIFLCMDKASYHTSNKPHIPPNIKRFFLPPRTPEMNPVELVWREIRKRGFKNKLFKTIEAVIAKFHEIANALSKETIKSITFWGWIEKVWIGEYV